MYISVKSYLSRNTGENCRNDQNQPVKMNHDLLENGLTDFSLTVLTRCVGCVVQIVQVS